MQKRYVHTRWVYYNLATRKKWSLYANMLFECDALGVARPDEHGRKEGLAGWVHCLVPELLHEVEGGFFFEGNVVEWKDTDAASLLEAGNAEAHRALRYLRAVAGKDEI